MGRRIRSAAIGRYDVCGNRRHVSTTATAGNSTFRIGVDVGGTFTDVVMVDESSGEVRVAKVHPFPADPSQGCINGIDKALSRYGLRPDLISFVVHGTTIATNTIIEGKAA